MTLTKNRFWISVIASSALYFFLYLFLNDVFIYVIGGAFGIVVRIFSKQTNLLLLTFLWVAALAAMTLFYYKVNNIGVKYLVLLLVAILLYVVDFVLYGTFSYTTDRMIIYFNVVALLIKGLVLALIVNFKVSLIVLSNDKKQP